MIQRKYYFNTYKNVGEVICRSEHEFHHKHSPLYANYLFGNNMAMHTIERWLSDDSSIGVIVSHIESENIEDKFNNDMLSCGVELVNGKVDYEVNYQIAKYSQNAIIWALKALNDDWLELVRDESLSDNTFILKYIPDYESDDDPQATDLPDDMSVEMPELPSKVTA